MPEMSGIEATEVIRKELPKDQQPIIIALTADAFAENRERCLRSGMNEVMTKPIQVNMLRNTLDKFLSSR